MSNIKITQAEIEKIVKEANSHLIEDRVSVETDPGAFTGMTYPYYGDELQVARKAKLGSYEKYVNACLQSLKQMVTQVNADYTNKNIQKSDVKFLIDDQIERLQAAVGFTISSLEAIVQNDGLKLHGAGPQYPAMMEEMGEPALGKEKVGAADIKKAGVAQGKEAAAATGVMAPERSVIKQLNDLIIKAANKGNITTGKTGKLIKLLAVELQKIINS